MQDLLVSILLMNRPEKLDSKTIKIKLTTDTGEITLYLTITYFNNLPYEVFVNCKDAKYTEHMKAMTIFVSRLLQANISISEVAKDLQGIVSPLTSHFYDGEKALSVYARIGSILEQEKSFE